MAEEKNLVEVSHLKQYFPVSQGFHKVPLKAVDDVSFTIRPGETLGLVGESGCGKTTILRVIAGFLEPDEGDVIFEDKKINGVPPHKRQVNTIFQRYALFPHLNVYENIAFGLRLKKMKEKDIQEILVKYLGEKVYRQKEDAECQIKEDKDIFERLKEEAQLDVETGIGYCMNQDFYLEVLKDFANAGKDTELEELFQQKDWNKYRTIVHALKSTSKTVGAEALSKEAEGLEMAAKVGDANYIEAHHASVMEHHMALKEQIKQIL